MHSPIRIIQITDTHILAREGDTFDKVDTGASLRAVIRLIQREPRPPDVLLATGDLVHDTVPAAYRRLRRMLLELGLPVYCIPGNHDDPALMARYLRGGNIRLKRRLACDSWQIVMLDSFHPRTHSGCLRKRELKFLDRALASAPDRPALIAMHHHPVPIGSPWMDKMALRNPDEFFQVLDRHPQVRAVIWGHIHQPFEDRRRGVRLLGAPSTCVQFTPRTDRYIPQWRPAGFRWLNLYPDGRCTTGIKRVSLLEMRRYKSFINS